MTKLLFIDFIFESLFELVSIRHVLIVYKKCFQSSACTKLILFEANCIVMSTVNEHMIVSSHIADIDECSSPVLNSCNENQTCSNVAGSYVCHCRNGYTEHEESCHGM